MATQAHSYQKLCGNGQQTLPLKDRAYSEQFPMSISSPKQSPVSSNPLYYARLACFFLLVRRCGVWQVHIIEPHAPHSDHVGAANNLIATPLSLTKRRFSCFFLSAFVFHARVSVCFFLGGDPSSSVLLTYVCACTPLFSLCQQSSH